MTNPEFVAGLRAVADWYEARPELNPPVSTVHYAYYGGDMGGGNLVDSKTGLRWFAKLAGKVRKAVTEYTYSLTAEPDANSTVAVCASRSAVCEPIEVGTRHVPPVVVPEQITPAYDEPIYEWRCPPILADEMDETEGDRSILPSV